MATVIVDLDDLKVLRASARKIIEQCDTVGGFGMSGTRRAIIVEAQTVIKLTNSYLGD